MTTPAERFREAVAQAAAGTPYVVTPTDEGFDVHLDIVNADWYGLFNKAGISKAYTHHVRVGDDGTYAVVDDSRTVEWVAGVPRVAATGERVVGRVKELGRQKVWAFDRHGRFGVQADFRFDSEEGRELITGVAEQLGLRQRRSTEEKIGIAFALVAVVGLVVGGLVVLVLWLLGALPQ